MENHESYIEDAIMKSGTNNRMITKWIVVAESINPETGQANFEAYSPVDQATWVSMGMMDYYQTVIRGRVAASDPKGRP